MTVTPENVYEAWQMCLKNRHVVDMTKCVEGQKLVSRSGKILTYVGKSDYTAYPHHVQFADGGFGTRTNEGWTYRNNPLPTDEDIVYIIPQVTQSDQQIDEKTRREYAQNIIDSFVD